MAKKKNDKKKQNKTEVSIQVSPHISAEDFQHIIANAIVEADEIKENNRRIRQENELKEWHAAIGYKEFTDKNTVLRTLKTFFNRLCSFVRICFISKDKIRGDRFSFGLIKLFLEMALTGTKCLLATLTLCSAALVFIHYLAPSAMDTSALNPASVIGIGLMSFLLSRFCRLASIEVEKLEDRNYLFALFAAIASIVTVAGAFVSLVKTVF